MKFPIVLSFCFSLLRWAQASCSNSFQCPLYNTCVGGSCVRDGSTGGAVNPVQFPVGACTTDNQCSANQRCSGGMCIFNTLPSNSFITSSSVCSPNPCQNTCSCVPSAIHEEGYYCTSNLSLLGKRCTIDAPSVSCGGTQISVKVSPEMLREYNMGLGNGHIYLGTIPPNQVGNDPSTTLGNCAASPTSDGGFTITLPLPFTACGTRVASSSGGQNGAEVFSNDVWLNTNGVLFDVPIPIFRWSCSYDSNYKVVTSLSPAVEPLRVAKTGVRLIQASVELCKIASACPNACPPLYNVNQGAVYTVSETIHVTISASYSNNAATAGPVYLQQLYLSCSSQPGSVDVALVSNGCTTSVLSTTISMNGVSNVVCVSFRVPRMLACSSFYVHGMLASGSARQACPGDFVRSALTNVDAESESEPELEPSEGLDVETEPGARKRRSVRAVRILNPANATNVIHIGPIVVIPSSPGKPYTEILSSVNKRTKFPKIPVLRQPSTEPTTFLGPSRQTVILATSIVGGCALLLICITLYVYTGVRT
uniref:ZP domain-containing protein n=1 Tax=Ciona savignyi TaxID=51511 RepID=H2YJQ9_CIOSA